MSKNETLTPIQAKLITRLLTGATVRAAAKECGIAEKTAFNYLNLPHVRLALSEGTEAIKRAGVERVALLAPMALDTIVEIMDDEEAPAHVRLRAAHILASRLTDVKPAEIPAVSTENAHEMIDYSLLDNNELAQMQYLMMKAKGTRKEVG